MKTMFKLMTSAVVLMSFATITNAQSTASASATATIVTPISIALTGTDLNFGNIAVGASGGTVIVSPAGVRSLGAGGGLTLPVANPGTISAAQFTVTGTGLYTYSVLVPTTVTITHTNGTDAMDLGLFTISTSAVTAGAGTGTLAAGGTQALNVGATLTVADGQPAGVYSNAAFDVTVNYN